ncbi:class I ribonucleotide reductase maintenance protein YfaE [Pectobacterium cacticida]|uniref:Class I ribonucleotide reductase maintenance protein YfaE n=1 Tax=Pectobacterium cacticida TaxID=69221 RepID=A0ABZ2G7V5_9GAMM|nr:class I ribonucleotide reductase maintenance protein YfaE [Pectobacterium cacticida]UYX07723.1 class I ribonucleotide reductase maintenance protein YfaE [Pectobacterium cacticida]
MSIPTIVLRTSGAQFPCTDDGRSLLDVLESNQVNIEYQCRSGYCGSCRLRLIKGNVAYRHPPLACIQPDEILPCCCRPQGDIELDL